MLDRDRFLPDPCSEYLPNPSMEEYLNYTAGPYTFRRLFTYSKDFTRQAELRNNTIIGVFLLSALPVAFHKKIYWFRKYQSKRT